MLKNANTHHVHDNWMPGQAAGREHSGERGRGERGRRRWLGEAAGSGGQRAEHLLGLSHLKGLGEMAALATRRESGGGGWETRRGERATGRESVGREGGGGGRERRAMSRAHSRARLVAVVGRGRARPRWRARERSDAARRARTGAGLVAEGRWRWWREGERCDKPSTAACSTRRRCGSCRHAGVSAGGSWMGVMVVQGEGLDGRLGGHTEVLAQRWSVYVIYNVNK